MTTAGKPFSQDPFRRKLERFEMLLAVAEDINSIHDSDELLQTVMTMIKDVVGVEASSLLLLDSATQELSYKVALGQKGHQVKEKVRLKLGQGIAGWVAQEGKPLVVNDVAGDPRFFSGVDAQTGFKTKAILSVPLKVKGVLRGALEAINPVGRTAFDALDEEVFIAFANQVGIALENARLTGQLRGENTRLKETLKLKGQIVGRSAKMQELFATISSLSASDSTVLLRGESGTGKELVARSIHENSARSSQPFICVTCSIFSESLLESELFGHEKGAFTGADTQKRGRFELAHEGTVFLDEIGTMSFTTQVKLLRFLQEKEFERVGGTETIKVNVRIIAATNENLEAAMQRGAFREDLYYRLKVIELMLPPLRERKEDIPLIAQYYLNIFCAEMGKPLSEMTPDFLEVLKKYPWPGNIRELKNTIERAVVLTKGVRLLPEHLGPEFSAPAKGAAPSSSRSLDEAQRLHIQAVLAEVNGNKSQAARALGISRNRLERKIKAYQINS